MAARRRLLHWEVEMTENTSKIFTEAMLALYEKYKDRVSINQGGENELRGKKSIEEGDSGKDNWS